MRLIPSFGAGKRPMKLKLLQYDLPALHGGEANSMMSSSQHNATPRMME
jgi:hypothetical protein